MTSKKINWDYHEIVDSTQLRAHKKIANIVYENPIAIVAKEQTAGIGLQGNEWKSPKGNLYFTFCFMPIKEQAYVFVALEIMARVLKKLTGHHINCINNDLKFNNKKCGGMIATWQEDLEKKDILCVGMGVNCASSVVTNQPTIIIPSNPDEVAMEWINAAEDILY